MAVDIIRLLQKDVILDTCTVYCLYATNQFIDILTWIPGQVYIASYVETVEVKELYNPATDSYIPVDLSAAKNSGLLKVTKPQPGPEALDAVNFASAMSTPKPGKNTGEAITGAIAKSRNWTMVTDDVDATDFLTKQGLGNNLTTSLHLIECWSRLISLPLDDVKQILESIRLHARYGPPPKNHPLSAWWSSF